MKELKSIFLLTIISYFNASCQNETDVLYYKNTDQIYIDAIEDFHKSKNDYQYYLIDSFIQNYWLLEDLGNDWNQVAKNVNGWREYWKWNIVEKDITLSVDSFYTHLESNGILCGDTRKKMDVNQLSLNVIKIKDENYPPKSTPENFEKVHEVGFTTTCKSTDNKYLFKAVMLGEPFVTMNLMILKYDTKTNKYVSHLLLPLSSS